MNESVSTKLEAVVGRLGLGCGERKAQGISLRPSLVVSILSVEVSNVQEATKNILLLIKNKDRMCKKLMPDWDPCRSHDKMDQAFPFCLHSASDQKLDGGKAWERD